ncbi:MAG: hypothetical protein HY868_24690 [Chloroflexi bacterium]|nr:hypothetical protein [Chloroflexota bacterium]
MSQEKKLPSYVIRIVYDIIAEETPNRVSHHRVFQLANLERYADQPPPFDDSPSITLREYEKVIGVVWQVFDEVQARDILRRTAQRGFENLTRSGTLAYTQFLRAFDSLGTKQERVALAVRKLADEMSRALGNYHEFRREGNDFVLDIHDCPYCAELLAHPPASSEARFCYSPVAFYEAAVTWASGDRHTVQETSCRVGTKQDYCRFKVFWNVGLKNKV